MRNKTIIIIVAATAICALVVLGIQFVRLTEENNRQEEDLKAAAEMLQMEKDQAQEDLQNMAAEINEYSGMNIGNDSLIAQIAEQKQKIQMLLDELRTVKTTDAKKISDLKNELQVVRLVLRDYIRQVDSLNRVNHALVTQNNEMKQKVEETAAQNEKLSKDKQTLTEVVTRAAMIDVDINSIETQNKRGKVTQRISKMRNIAINLTIGKNVTTKVGYKTIYIRILKPSGDCLTSNKKDVFKYEGHYIGFSLKKDIEYKGEKQTQTLYYPITETLLPGTYKATVFIDGSSLASSTFVLKK